jgi:putative heme-binding domain-containing protein
MNFRNKIIYALAGILFTLAAGLLHQTHGQQATTAPKSNQAGASADGGKKTFEAICASCHGLDGRGGERGPNLATAQEVQNLSDSEILKIVREGKGYAGMPGFAALGGERLEEILGYLRKLQGRDTAVELPGNPASGKILFFGKAGCESCHMIQGRGGYIGSDLSEYGAENSAKEIRESIVHPNQDGDPRQRVLEVTTQDGQTFKGIARNEDNFSLQLQTLDGTFHLLRKNTLKSFKDVSPSLMPGDYGTKLRSQELDDLVHYLISVAKTNKNSQVSPKEKGDEN